ncbi:MAG: sporulation protein YunB [Clostridia bacterium]|nr:sporulation protein YunB [Clostridia bacterium]
MKKHRHKVRKSRKKRIIKDAAFILAVFIAFIFIYSYQIFPALSVAATSYLNNRVYEQVNSSVLAYLQNNPHESFIEITYSTDGKVSSVQAMVNEINLTRANVSKELLTQLRYGDISEVKLPLGCLFGNDLAYAKGPLLSFNTLSSERFVCKVESEFSENGINQTIHRLYLVFSVELVVSFPLKNIKVPIQCKYLLSEVVIVGDVPSAYTKINRFFDDLSESEIDDIYDFGAIE